MFDRSGEGFTPDPSSATVLRKVNSAAALVYAAAISADGLELFFTAASPAVGQAPTIYRAARSAPSKPFGAPERIASISGFAEAPSLSSDGSSLYYHELVGQEFAIERVTRAPTPAPTVTTVSPKKGSASGGATLHIKGANLAAVTSVSIGGLQAGDIQVRSGSEITVVTPAGVAGFGDVLVTTPSGTSAAAAGARFGSTPLISAAPSRQRSRTGRHERRSRRTWLRGRFVGDDVQVRLDDGFGELRRLDDLPGDDAGAQSRSARRARGRRRPDERQARAAGLLRISLNGGPGRSITTPALSGPRPYSRLRSPFLISPRSEPSKLPPVYSVFGSASQNPPPSSYGIRVSVVEIPSFLISVDVLPLSTVSSSFANVAASYSASGFVSDFAGYVPARSRSCT